MYRVTRRTRFKCAKEQKGVLSERGPASSVEWIYEDIQYERKARAYKVRRYAVTDGRGVE